MRTLTGAMIALLTATTAMAQPGPAGEHGGSPMAGRMPMMSMGGHCAMMGRTEGALAFLKTELKITSAQEKAWEAFAALVRQEAANKPKGPAGHGHGPKGASKPDAPEPFPQAVTRRLQMMDQHHESLKKLSDAAKPLYDGLNTEQRKTADELLMHFVMSHCMM
jgi:hypothetical protein